MPWLFEPYKVQKCRGWSGPWHFELCRVQKAQVRRSEKQNSHRLPWNQHSSTASPRQFWGFLGPSTAMKAPSQPTKLKIVHAWVFWTLQSSKYQGPEPYTVFFLNVPQTSQSSRANLTVSFFLTQPADTPWYHTVARKKAEGREEPKEDITNQHVLVFARDMFPHAGACRWGENARAVTKEMSTKFKVLLQSSNWVGKMRWKFRAFFQGTLQLEFCRFFFV